MRAGSRVISAALLSIGGHATLLGLFFAAAGNQIDPPLPAQRITVMLPGPPATAPSRNVDRDKPPASPAPTPALTSAPFPPHADAPRYAPPVPEGYSGDASPVPGAPRSQSDTAAVPAPSGRPADSLLVDRWELAVLESLERGKRYPPRARSEGLADTVSVRIRVDRAGRVLASSISRSHGIALLDRAALDLVRRTSPLPPPPRSLDEGALEFVVPLEYSLEEERR